MTEQPEPQPQPWWGSDALDDDPPPTDRLREEIADELGRHQGLRGPMDDERPDVWQNRCDCGWDDGDERPGWRDRYRLHIADELLSGPIAPLLARLARVEALAEAARGGSGEVWLEDLRRALDGP